MRPGRRRALRGLLGALCAPALPLAARAAGSVHHVDIRGFAFEPEEIAVEIGDRIVFTNHDIAPHTATARDVSWDTGTLEAGEHTELTVTEAWTSDFFCVHHPAMEARLLIS